MNDLKQISLNYILRLCTTKAHYSNFFWMYAVCEHIRKELNLHGGYAPISNKRVVNHKVLVRKSNLKIIFSKFLNVLKNRRVIS